MLLPPTDTHTHTHPPSVKHLLSSECVLTCPACQLNPLLLNPFSPYGSATSLLQCVQRVCVWRLLVPDYALKSFSRRSASLKSPLGSLRIFLALCSKDFTSVLSSFNLFALSAPNCYTMLNLWNVFLSIIKGINFDKNYLETLCCMLCTKFF